MPSGASSNIKKSFRAVGRECGPCGKKKSHHVLARISRTKSRTRVKLIPEGSRFAHVGTLAQKMPV